MRWGDGEKGDMDKLLQHQVNKVTCPEKDIFPAIYLEKYLPVNFSLIRIEGFQCLLGLRV